MSLSRSTSRRTLLAPLAALALLAGAAASAGAETTGRFAGTKVNGGTATFAVQAGKRTLTLSDDFQVPDTPDPHWQVVDSEGTVYALARLPIKGDRVNRSVEVPAYVPDVAKVQIWCAFAETLLGEASFPKPVK